MNLPEKARGAFVTSGDEGNLMSPEDRVSVLSFSVLTAVSAVIAVFMTLFRDWSLTCVFPVMAVPFLALGTFRYVADRAYLPLAAALIVSAVLYVLDSRLVVFGLILILCTKGAAELTALLQRIFLYRVYNRVQFFSSKKVHGIVDKIVGFLFNIPRGLDTRNLLMDRHICRNRFPTRDVLKTTTLALLISLFVWIAVCSMPGYSPDLVEASAALFTVALYVCALSMPFCIIGTVDLRVKSGDLQFRLYSGLMETVKRMFVPGVLALAIVMLGTGIGCDSIEYILASAVSTVVSVFSVSAIYYARNESAVVADISDGEGHVDIFAELKPGRRSEHVPGTPVRDPRSCFQDPESDQKN